jgi:hypothetical protein
MLLHLTSTHLLALVANLAQGVVADVQFFASPSALPDTIPLDCRTALSANISCPVLISANDLLSTAATNETILREYCDCNCTESLTVRVDTLTHLMITA